MKTIRKLIPVIILMSLSAHAEDFAPDAVTVTDREAFVPSQLVNEHDESVDLEGEEEGVIFSGEENSWNSGSEDFQEEEF